MFDSDHVLRAFANVLKTFAHVLYAFADVLHGLNDVLRAGEHRLINGANVLSG